MFRNIRCMTTAMLTLALCSLAFSAAVQAAFLHGGNTLRGCAFPEPRTCDVDADCEDGDACTEHSCDLAIPDFLQCEFSFTNTDETEIDVLFIRDGR